MKGSRSKEILTGWNVQAKPAQLHLTTVNEGFCSGGRKLWKDRVEQIQLHSRRNEAGEIGNCGKTDMQKVGPTWKSPDKNIM